MDLMAVRRRLVMGMAQGIWKQKHITADSAFTNARDVGDWVIENLPTGTIYAVLIRDDMDVANFANNQCLSVTTISGSLFNYVRLRDGVYQAQLTFAIGYDLIVSQGDRYTLFYQ